MHLTSTHAISWLAPLALVGLLACALGTGLPAVGAPGQAPNSAEGSLRIPSTTPVDATPVDLGSIELTGGSTSKEVDTNAITPGPGPEMVGRITNKLGREMHDLTVSVKRTNPNATPPASDGNTTVSCGQGQSEGGNTSTDDGYTATIQFGGAGCPPPAHTDTVDVSVDVVNAGNGQTVKVFFTPSYKDKPKNSQAHADVLQSLSLSEAAPGGTHSLASPFHDRGHLGITNTGSKPIVDLSGTCTLPAGISLSSIHLEDPSMAFASPAGANVQITGNSFTVSGFAALPAGATYDLIAVFSAAPAKGYRIRVEATFDE